MKGKRFNFFANLSLNDFCFDMKISGNVAEKIAGNVTEKISEKNVAEKISARNVTEKIPGNVTEKISGNERKAPFDSVTRPDSTQTETALLLFYVSQALNPTSTRCSRIALSWRETSSSGETSV